MSVHEETRRIRGFLALAAAALLAVGCGCSKQLIPNYEVLLVPAGAERYPVGYRWNVEIKAVDSAAPVVDQAAIATADGVSSLHTGTDRNFEAKLKVPVIEWIGGSLGIKTTDVVEIRLGNLQHHFVRDTSTAQTTKAILLETVTADSIEMKVDRSVDAALELNVDVVKAGLARNADANIGLTVTSSETGQYEVTSDRPLVVAIRAVKIEMEEPFEQTVPLDLSSAAEGREQMAALGYTLTRIGTVDPVSGIAEMRIANPTFIRWPPIAHTFRRAENYMWINDNREAIASARDPRVKDDVYVWDYLLLQPHQDLAMSECKVVRQYQKERTIKSGLDTR